LAIAVTFGTAGCGFLAPQSTTRHYDASDGVSGNVGNDIAVRNALIVTGDGTIGNLVVTIVNNGAVPHRVQIERATGSQESTYVTVRAGQTLEIGSAGETIILLKDLNSIPGSLYPLYFQYGAQTGLPLRVPVLDGGLPEYADLTPAKVATDTLSTSTPTATPGATSAATPTPTSTP
jgi:hypothetical protein